MQEENKDISVDSLKTLQGSNSHRYEDHAAFVEKINLKGSLHGEVGNELYPKMFW